MLSWGIFKGVLCRYPLKIQIKALTLCFLNTLLRDTRGNDTLSENSPHACVKMKTRPSSPYEHPSQTVLTENTRSLQRSNCFKEESTVSPLVSQGHHHQRVRGSEERITLEKDATDRFSSVGLPPLGDWQRTRQIHPIECHTNTQPPRPAVLWLLLVYPGYWPVLCASFCYLTCSGVRTTIVCIRDGLEGCDVPFWPYRWGSEASWRDQSERQAHCLRLWWRMGMCVCVCLEARWHSQEPHCR